MELSLDVDYDPGRKGEDGSHPFWRKLEQDDAARMAWLNEQLAPGKRFYSAKEGGGAWSKSKTFDLTCVGCGQKSTTNSRHRRYCTPCSRAFNRRR